MLKENSWPYTLSDYQYGFSQPYPAYGLKDASGWRTVHSPLTQQAINAHLMQKISIGTYGRWYPRYGIIDLDDVSVTLLYEVRDRLGMNDHNSAIFTSESPNSYHIYFKPTKNGKMINLNLYLKCMAAAKETMNIEIYPQATRFIRLPFGKGQQWFNGTMAYRINYKEGMDLLTSLQEYDVSFLPYIPQLLDDHPSYQQQQALVFDNGLKPGWKQEGLALINAGLQDANSRLEGLKRVIYFYWSQNLPVESTISLTQSWLQNKHNGFSKDFLRNPHQVFKQIVDLSYWIYDHFDRSYVLPDSAHIVDKGYLTADLTQKIVVASQGSLPLLKFGLHLFAYLTPRHSGANKIAVHRNRLVEWSSTKNYLSYLDHFKNAGLIKRDARYRVGHYAKGISLLSDYSPLDQAIKFDEVRPADGLHEIIPQVYSPHDYAKQLKTIGLDRRNINMQISLIWQEDKPKAVRTKKQSTKERVLDYLKDHPQASSRAIAQALGISHMSAHRHRQL